jgi:hypothetical protein
MGCESCKPFCQERAIDRPEVLDALLGTVANAVREGLLRVDAGSIAWDDSVDCELSCSECGQRFELRCETYHGSGGTWRPA